MHQNSDIATVDTPKIRAVSLINKFPDDPPKKKLGAGGN